MTDANAGRIVFDLAEAGDPLCSVIKSCYDYELFAKNNQRRVGRPCLIMGVLLKILRRTMTEREYNGLLNGELPFAINGIGNQLYLSSKRENACVEMGK